MRRRYGRCHGRDDVFTPNETIELVAGHDHPPAQLDHRQAFSAARLDVPPSELVRLAATDPQLRASLRDGQNQRVPIGHRLPPAHTKHVTLFRVPGSYNEVTSTVIYEQNEGAALSGKQRYLAVFRRRPRTLAGSEELSTGPT